MSVNPETDVGVDMRDQTGPQQGVGVVDSRPAEDPAVTSSTYRPS